MNSEAEQCNREGLKLLHAGKHKAAIDFFSKAIALDPTYPDPYHNRGEIQLMLGNVIEGNTDLHKARDLRAGYLKKSGRRRTVQKFNWQEVDSIYDSVFADDPPKSSADNETISFDSEIYDYVFSDDRIETEQLWDALVEGCSENSGCAAVIEFLDGRREEVSRLLLFQPTGGEVSIINMESGKTDRVIPLSEICCIRLAAIPVAHDQTDTKNCKVEIIQTVDGNLFHELIHPDLHVEQGLFAVSTKKETFLPYTFFPRDSIKSRCLQRQLGEILLEKRFISHDALKNALEEHAMRKSMPLGKIIARQEKIHCSAIESALKKAAADGKEGLRIGEILLDAGLVREERVLEALALQKKMQGGKIGEFLVSKGILREQELFISLAEKFRIPFIDLRKQKVPKKILNLLPREIVLKYSVMPIGRKGDALVIASSRPDAFSIRKSLARYLGHKEIQFVLVQPTHLRNVINMLFKNRSVQSGSA